MSDHKFKICLIGCGGMSRLGHAPACKLYAETHRNAELSACCDVDIERAEQFCKNFGFRSAYTDYMEMIQNEKPDVVLVIVPVHLTAKISKDVIGTKTNIILEKPPGIDIAETRSIHECAVKNNVHARVAFNRRYTPVVMELIREIEACGKPILHIDCNFIRYGRTDADFCTTAIHGIDSLRYIVKSDYKKADFIYQDTICRDKKVTNFYVSAEFENSVHGSIHFLPCSGCGVERIHVSCVDYSFFAELPIFSGNDGVDRPGRLVCTKENTIYRTVIGDKDTLFESNGFYEENASFFDLIQSGVSPSSDVATGIQSVEIADCLRKRKPGYSKAEEAAL